LKYNCEKSGIFVLQPVNRFNFNGFHLYLDEEKRDMNQRVGSFFTLALVVVLCSVAANAQVFTAYLTGAQEVPAVATTATGYARVTVNRQAGTLSFQVVFNGLTSTQNASHIHAPAPIGSSAAVAINFGAVGGTSGTVSGTTTITPTQLQQILAHQGYVNVHSNNFPNGEIRGQLGLSRPVDNDGDGRTDYSIARFPNNPTGVSQITNYVKNSTAPIDITPWGDANTDFPAPGDYDGDGKTDLAIYRDAGNIGTSTSEFWVLNSASGIPQKILFGLAGDQSEARDYDGDGKCDLAVYRRGINPNDPAFYVIRRSSDNQVVQTAWGLTGDVAGGTSGDTPAPGDYDGDGIFDLAVYRFGGIATPNNAYLVLRSSDGGWTTAQVGDFNTDYIVPGDYDGDGKYDFVAVRTGAAATTPMVWNIWQSSNNQLRSQTWGISSDLPAQGDYDGDGRTDIAIYRPGATATAQSNYWVFNSFTNATTITPWGIGGDFSNNRYDIR
jgi:hypothetical protein